MIGLSVKLAISTDRKQLGHLAVGCGNNQKLFEMADNRKCLKALTQSSMNKCKHNTSDTPPDLKLDKGQPAYNLQYSMPPISHSLVTNNLLVAYCNYCLSNGQKDHLLHACPANVRSFAQQCCAHTHTHTLSNCNDRFGILYTTSNKWATEWTTSHHLHICKTFVGCEAWMWGSGIVAKCHQYHYSPL